MSSAGIRSEDSEVHDSPDDSGEAQGASANAKSRGRKERLASKVSEKDETSLGLVALRDIALLAGLLSLFAAAASWASMTGLAFATGLATVDGLLVGAATGAICHEWGHFAGARLAGGHSPLKPIGQFFPVFDFDYKNNDARSFDWMSIGGNVGDLSIVLLFFIALPMSSPGHAALVAGATGFAVFAAAIEFPVIRRARSGMTSIEALSAIPRDFLRRYTRWGIAAAIATLILL
jgi:hypothetical protein